MKKSILALVAVAALAAAPASAHHSGAMFDNTKLVVLRGTMLSFSNMNPHAWISVNAAVDGKGKPARWDVEGVAPGMLAMQGINTNTLKTGDKVTIGIRPLRDGRRAGALVFVVTPDGVPRGAKPESLGLKAEDLKPS